VEVGQRGWVKGARAVMMEDTGARAAMKAVQQWRWGYGCLIALRFASSLNSVPSPTSLVGGDRWIRASLTP
jgi:hypothetical protein